MPKNQSICQQKQRPHHGLANPPAHDRPAMATPCTTYRARAATVARYGPELQPTDPSVFPGNEKERFDDLPARGSAATCSSVPTLRLTQTPAHRLGRCRGVDPIGDQARAFGRGGWLVSMKYLEWKQRQERVAACSVGRGRGRSAAMGVGFVVRAWRGPAQSSGVAGRHGFEGEGLDAGALAGAAEGLEAFLTTLPEDFFGGLQCFARVEPARCLGEFAAHRCAHCQAEVGVDLARQL